MAAGMMVAAATAVVAFALSLAFVTYMPRSVLDLPGHRSSHTVPTPRIGGVAVMVGALAGALTSFQLTISAGVVLGCATALGVVGLLDDRRAIPVHFRLIAQLSVGLIAASALAHVGQGFSLWWVAPVALFVAAYVNAFNFMDGVNGISALNAMVAGVAFISAAVHADSRPVILLGVLIAASAAGFLPVNASGRLFLGDSGSYFLGSAIALTALVGVVDGGPWPVLMAPMAVYFADTGLTLLSRLRRGQNITQPHREHIYQRLLGGQWGHRHSAVLAAVASVTCCLGAWVAVLGSAVLGSAMAAAALLCYVTAPKWVDARTPLVEVVAPR